MKDVKKLLAQQSKNILPDGRIKENVKRELGFADADTNLAYAGGGQTQNRADRKKRVALAAAALAAIALLCALIPVFAAKTRSPSSPSGNKFDRITNADTFYAYGAASVGIMLSSANAAGETQAMRVKSLAAVQKSVSEERLDTINRYMPLVESLLGDENIAGSAVAGGAGYAFGMIVSYTDLLGNTLQYTLYYDKLFLSGETDGDETEENYAIEGVLLTADGETYEVLGNYQTETEENETEGELYFRAYTDEGKTSYIEVEQEYENETEGRESETEKKYVYSIWRQGERTEKTEAEYESEEGELELQLVIEKDGYKDELTFLSGGETHTLRASGSVGGVQVRFTVYIREGSYHYEFDDGWTSDHDRYRGDD